MEGFDIKAGVDIKGIALATFRRNFPAALAIDQDLARVSPDELIRTIGMAPGDLDCLVGGPPCQGFSKNVPAAQRRLADPRNRLILRFLDFVRALRPKTLLIENVAEMKNAYDETYSHEIHAVLDGMGYRTIAARLNAADYGVPQLRRRAFFFASRIGQPTIPTATHAARAESDLVLGLHPPHVTVWDAIGDLPRLASGAGVSPVAYRVAPQNLYQRLSRSRTTSVEDHVARALTPVQLERVAHLTPGKGGGAESLPEHLRPRMGYSGAYARLRQDEPARTITRWVFHPGSGRYYHPFDDRVITIREAARLQSFPDWFTFEGSYVKRADQVGEAVPPLLAAAFAREVRNLIAAETDRASSRRSRPDPDAATQAGM
jgi:DNA (cytosine-5)-methyltransferase 1